MTESDGVDETVLASTIEEVDVKLREHSDKTSELSHLVKVLDSIKIQTKRVSNDNNGFDMVEVYPTDKTFNNTMTEERRKEIYDHCIEESKKVLV